MFFNIGEESNFIQNKEPFLFYCSLIYANLKTFLLIVLNRAKSFVNELLMKERDAFFA